MYNWEANRVCARLSVLVFLICRSCWGDDKEWLVRHLQERFVSTPAADPSILLNCEKA